MTPETLAELIAHHKTDCMKWSRTGFCSTRACLMRGGWVPGGAPVTRYEVARCLASDTVEALQALAVVKAAEDHDRLKPPSGWTPEIREAVAKCLEDARRNILRAFDLSGLLDRIPK